MDYVRGGYLWRQWGLQGVGALQAPFIFEVF